MSLRAPITALCFAPDGKSLVAASQAGLSVYSWSLTTTSAPPKSEIRNPKSEIGTALPNLHALAFSPDGKMLAVGGGAPAEWGRVELRAWPAGTVVRALGGHTDEVNAVGFSPDGAWLASGGADGTIRLFDVALGKAQRTLAGHAGPVLAVAFSPDGQWLASGSADRSIKLWEVASGRLVRTLTNHLGAVEAVVFGRPASGVHALASAGADATVRLWQPEIGRLVRIICGHEGAVLDLCYTPDGGRLLSAATDGRVRLIAGDSDAILQTFEVLQEWVYSVAVSPDGAFVVAGDAGGRLWAWRLGDG